MYTIFYSMINGKKIGCAVITCRRPDYLRQLLQSMKDCKQYLDELIIINDGDPESVLEFTNDYELYTNPINLGVGKSKNKALDLLKRKNCDYYFIIEDDMVILDPTIFKKYIDASDVSGIQHFNYGPGSPFNREQKIKDFDLHNRHLLDQHSTPKPQLIIDYKTLKIALYQHTVAMFSFFTKQVINEVGGIDDKNFTSAFDHVEHTYRIIKQGFHPPFWYFADIDESWKYITEAPDAIKNSVIAKDETKWMTEVHRAREVYKTLHGHYPNQPPYQSVDDVIKSLKQIKNKYGRK